MLDGVTVFAEGLADQIDVDVVHACQSTGNLLSGKEKRTWAGNNTVGC